VNSQEQALRIVKLEEQMARLASDAESEKDTRSRSNDRISVALREIELRQTKLERIIYMGLGGLGVLQFLLSLKG
jgi:hypothetical protein